MLAAICCLKAWRYFLEKTKERFKILTDHKNLKYFIKSQKLNQRQARQALYLLRFNFVLKHILDESIEITDELSRRPDYEIEVEKDNENQKLLKLEQFKAQAAEKKKGLIEGVHILEK